MDSRDWIILGAVGVGGYFAWRSGLVTRLFQYGLPSGTPAADANPAGASSMVSGAAAQTQAGTGSARGLFPGAIPAPFGLTHLSLVDVPVVARAGMIFTRAARAVIGVDNTPQPVASTPFRISSPTTGIGPTLGISPPPQRLNPTINPNNEISSSGLRGVL